MSRPVKHQHLCTVHWAGFKGKAVILARGSQMVYDAPCDVPSCYLSAFVKFYEL